MIARFPIGTKYIQKDRVCEVIDILKTYNNANELVCIRYLSQHDFMGQKIKNHDICDTTIARNLVV